MSNWTFVTKNINILKQVGFLFLFSFLGKIIQSQLHLPIPGSIIGMLLLLILLETNIVSVHWIADGAGFLLSFLPLLFVPVFIGIMNYPSLLSLKGLLLIVIVIGSTLVTMLISGATSQLIERQNNKMKGL
ncbi:MAG: CidA/LrgA family holin-like protein [Bacillus sp. (in: firmicutes)]